MSLMGALNLKSDVSICKSLGRLLKIFDTWNEKVLRPVSVLTHGMTTLLLFLRVFILWLLLLKTSKVHSLFRTWFIRGSLTSLFPFPLMISMALSWRVYSKWNIIVTWFRPELSWYNELVTSAFKIWPFVSPSLSWPASGLVVIYKKSDIFRTELHNREMERTWCYGRKIIYHNENVHLTMMLSFGQGSK